MKGTRYPDGTSPVDLEPGGYALAAVGGKEHSIMWACLPNGTFVRVDHRWKLIVEDDESVTVGPLEPGGSCSIKVEWPSQPEKSWHGHLTRGEWTTA